MTLTATDRKRQVVTELRRGEILDAATRVFGSKGFEATRMDDIAIAAGLAKGTLYLYFPSKDSVYEATVQQAVTELSELTEQHVAAARDFPGQLGAFIAVRISFWKEKQALYRVILSMNRESNGGHRSLKWQQKAVDFLSALFASAAQQGEIPEQDFDSAAWAVLDLIRGANERRILREVRSPAEEAEILKLFALNALRFNRPE